MSRSSLSESHDIMLAARKVEQERRRASFARRHEDFAVLEAAGFRVTEMKYPQHCRVKLPGYGFVDFWPSTWRWHEKLKGAETFSGVCGHGLESMLAHLKSIPKG